MLKLSITFAMVLLVAGVAATNATQAATTKSTVQSSQQAKATGKAVKKTSKVAVTAKRSNKKIAAKKVKSRTTARAFSAKSRKVAFTPAKPSFGDLAGLQQVLDPLDLKSNAALVIDQASSQVLFEKNSDVSLPMASITKLMTSLVVLEAGQDMNEMLEVTSDDIDFEKGTGSRLRVGSRLSRADMMHIALMSSENRAASALGRNYPGGLKACLVAMNAKAKALGMRETRYADATGLSSLNVASAQDLAKLVRAAYEQPVIRQYSTDTKYAVYPGYGTLEYISSNKLTSKPDWEIGLQKTGYISEAGRCLVMQAMIQGRAVVMVFLDSKGKYSRFADAGRIRAWLEKVRSPVTKGEF